MNDATFPLGLELLDSRTSSALFLALFEQLLKMPADKSRPVLASLVEQWLKQPAIPLQSPQIDDSWHQWFDFCEALPSPSSRSYQDILEDEDRR